jgi:threonylcarbamoyladenosine tRNA methylthiotransferase CDKAL1
MKYYIETYGCTANFGNSQELSDELMYRGHTASGLEEADLIIVNTCAVTARTQRKIRKRLEHLSGPRLIVAGCLSAALPASLNDIICRARFGVLNRESAGEIASLSSELQLSSGRLPNQIPARVFNSPNLSESGREHACGIINIAEGCLGHCGYCIVRRARGGLKSRNIDEVIDSAMKLISSGAAEIQLAAQDTASYGRDIGTDLPDLLKNLAGIPGDFMMRVGMMNPDQALPIKKELAMALNHPKVFKFLHLPLQSGSNFVLRRMIRGYTSEEFQEVAGYLKRSVEDLTITTDAIVGFPGETVGDFQDTIEIIKWLQPDKVNVTRFSRRPGTPAFQLYDMPDRVKKERSRVLTRLWMQISEDRNRKYEGKTLAALVTETGKGMTMKARTSNYTGVVIAGRPALGSQINVKVKGSNSFFLLAEQI